MDDGFLRIALFLAYGPFVLALGLYLAGLVLRCCGRPQLLTLLVERTREQKPVSRPHDTGH